MNSKTKIEILYKLMYPFKRFNGNYPDGCLELKKDISNMCTPETKIPLLMLGRILDMEYDINALDWNMICINITNKISSLCEPFKPLTICDMFIKLLKLNMFSDNVFDSIYSKKSMFYPTFKINSSLTSNQIYKSLNKDPSINADTILRNAIIFNKNMAKQYSNVSDNFDNFDDSDDSDIDILEDKLLLRLMYNGNASELGRLSPELKRIYFDLHNLFRTKKIPLNIKKSELCANPEIIKLIENRYSDIMNLVQKYSR